MCNGQQTTVHRFDNNRLLRSLFILEHIGDGLRRGILTTKRGILYYYMHRFGKEFKDSFVKAFKYTMNGIGIPTNRMLTTEPTTLAFGNLCIKNVKTGVTFDLLKMDQLDMSITEDDWEIVSKGNITRIIVIEKATLFRQMKQTNFHEKMEALLMTDRGFATFQGKVSLYKFRKMLGISENECYGVGDYGPYGYSVLHSFGYAKDPIKCENIFRTRLQIVMTPALMHNFPEARNAENTDFSDADVNIFKFLLNDKNQFFKHNGKMRWNQLKKMYQRNFKCDVDLLDIEKLLAALEIVIKSGLTM